MRAVAAYFALLGVLAVADAIAGAARLTALLGVAASGAAALGLARLYAEAVARSTVYTLTNRRVVIRSGVALPKCLNLPLVLVGSVALRERSGGTGDVALAVTGARRIGYLVWWPHVRPWRLAAPEPTLRALPDAAAVAARIGRACLAVQPDGALHATTAPEAAPAVAPAGALAA